MSTVVLHDYVEHYCLECHSYNGCTWPQTDVEPELEPAHAGRNHARVAEWHPVTELRSDIELGELK
jgi:hypothetical protein